LVTIYPVGTNMVLEAWNTDTWQRKGSLNFAGPVDYNSVNGVNRRVFTTALPNSLVILTEGAVQFFNVTKLNDAPKLFSSGGYINELVVSPDGRIAAGASDTGFVRLWEMATLQPVETIRSFLLGEVSVAFSPDGRRLAAGANGQEAVKLFDTETRQEVLTLSGEASLFFGLKFSPDGRYILAINPGGVARLWSAPTFAEIDAAEAAEKQGHQQ
jgi:WD40 repeat protein